MLWYKYIYVYCNIPQMTSLRVKNTKSTTRDEVEWRDCCSLHAVTSSVIYLFYTSIALYSMVLQGMALYGKPDYNWQGMAITSYCIISDGMTHGIYSNKMTQKIG